MLGYLVICICTTPLCDDFLMNICFNYRMQKLTGGIILSRNKDFLVFYRGKNFLSSDVTQALLERERMAKAMQDEEEHARLRASSLILPSINTSELSAEAGTLGETLDADAKWGKMLDERHKQKVMREVEQLRHAKLVRKLEDKLSLVSPSSLCVKSIPTLSTGLNYLL